MSGPDVRLESGLVVRIDRTLCVGFGDCIEQAPEAFALDEEGIAIVVAPESLSERTAREAATSCPVDAILVLDAAGRQLAP